MATGTVTGKATNTAAGMVTGVIVAARAIIDKVNTDMRRISILVVATASLLAATARAHDAPNLEHTHAFQQTAYGSYRQGHHVKGPQGDIIIWSPRTYTGYQQGPAVRFARPQPITKAPGSPALESRAGHQPAHGYGKQERREYGD